MTGKPPSAPDPAWEQVTDLGVSTALEDGEAGTCDAFVGTLKYMSPERMRSEKYGYSADVWSLGLVLMECATDAFPYQVKNP